MKKLKFLKLIFIAFILSFVLSACGGGTSGTGGNNRITRIEGTLLQKNTTSPVPGVTVTLQQTGSETVTNASGDFVIIVSIDLDEADFVFSGSGISDTSSVGNIPDSARVIDLEFEADIDSGEVDLEDTDFEDSLSDGEFCDIFPDDPTCEDDLDDFCLVFPNDPFCEEVFIDDFCVDFPDDPFCIGEDEIFDETELDFCEEFPDDELCFEDEFIDDCEFEDVTLCDDDFIDDFCVEFPDDPDCLL